MVCRSSPASSRGLDAGCRSALVKGVGNGVEERRLCWRGGGGDEQFRFPPLPCDRYPSSGHALSDLPPHRRIPARQPQRGPDRALPPGPPRSARPFFPVASPAGQRHRPMPPRARADSGRPYCRARPVDANGDGAWPNHVRVRAQCRRYTGDRRSPKPFGRITLDTRVIIARFFDSIQGNDHPCITRSAPGLAPSVRPARARRLCRSVAVVVEAWTGPASRGGR
jgi:hypothetical protein